MFIRMSVRRVASAAVIGAVAVAGVGCAKDRDSGNPALTPGAVKATVTVGQTTQNEITEIFGGPDWATHENGRDIWTYESADFYYEQHGAYFNVLVFGVSSRRQTSSGRSTMVRIYFDENDVVSEYRMNSVRR